jgi:hypothetical protein
VEAVAMTERLSICIAALIHFIFRFTLFIEQQKHPLTTSLMGISNVLILASFSMFLRNFTIIPTRYKQKSHFVVAFVEIFCCLFLMEVVTLVIWTNFETFIEYFIKVAFKANKLVLYEEMGGDSLLGFFILTIAIYFFAYTIQVTQNTQLLENLMAALISKMELREMICKGAEKSPEAHRSVPKVIRKKSSKPAVH